MESLPVMLGFALLLFGVAITVCLWDPNVSIAEVVLVVTSAGLAFYAYITVAATIWNDCPFQTPLSVLLPRVIPWTKGFIALARVWWRRWWRRRTTLLVLRIKAVEYGRLTRPLGRLLKTFLGGTNISTNAGKGAFSKRYPITLSNPAFRRRDPLFTCPIPKDITASAGLWLLENSTDYSAATAAAAVFSEFQWRSHQCSTTSLIRLRDAYVECFRALEFKKSTRLKALQFSAAYYADHPKHLTRQISVAAPDVTAISLCFSSP